MKKLNYVALSILFSLLSFPLSSQINQALTGTANHSGGGVTIYGPQNYNDGIIPAGTATPWGWVSTNGWIEYTWTSAVNFNAIAFYKATRPMTTCTIQYWDGTQYVTFYNYNNSNTPYDSISFPTISTTRLRFDVVAGSGNPNHREIRVWLNSFAPNDAAIARLDSPSVFCAGMENIVATVANYGTTTIDSVDIDWEFNGVPQTGFRYYGFLDTVGGLNPSSAQVFLGTKNFPAGSSNTIKVWSSTPNGIADTVNTNDTLTATVGPALQGNFTVNPSVPASSTNFQSMTAMAAALNNYGVCSPVNILVAPGVYNEMVELGDINGASSVNTVTIDGGDSTQTKLLHNGAGNIATLTLDGTDWVTVKNMTIQATSTNGVAVLFTGGNDHCTITNNVLRVSTSSTSSLATNVTFSGSKTSPTSTVSTGYSNNLIANNRMRGGYYGVRMYGITSQIDCIGNRVMKNDMDSIYYYGVYVYYQDSAEVVGNRIIQTNRGNVNGDGIYMYANNNGRIVGNFIMADDYAMYWSNSNTLIRTLNRPNEVINNMSISRNDFAAYLYSVDSVNVWFNSFSAQGTSPAFYLAGSTAYPIGGWDMRNNIFSASGGGPALRMLTYGSSIFNKMDNNDYYTTSGTLIEDLGTSYSNLPAYQTAQPLLNNSSLEGDPQFLSADDLHIIGAFVNDSGDASVPITIDIDGEVRPRAGALSVDIGADEFNPPTCPPASNVMAMNPSLDSVTLVWNSAGVGVSYEYILVTGGTPQSSGTPVVTGMDSIRVGGLTASTRYDFYLRVICGRGDTSLWVGPVSFNTANGIPYFQDFQAWTLNTSGLINEEGWYTLGTPTPHWEISTLTTSGATGPTADHTIGTGGTFLHLECSGGTTGDDDTLWSAPIFVGANQNAIEFEFWYHMYGAAMGSMEVYVENLNGLNFVTSIVGQQQTVQTAPWLSFDTLLTGYAGQSIQLVFVGIRGTSFTSDMAIDDVSLDLAPALDLAVAALPTPIDDSLQCYTSSESVSVEILNAGTSALDFTTDTVDITVNVNGAVTATLTYQLNSNALNSGSPLSSGNSISVPMGTVNMTNLGTYTFATNAVLNGDGDLSNNTLTRSLTTLAQSAGTVNGTDSICLGDSVEISTSGAYGTIQWQIYNGTTWNNIPGANGTTITVAPTVNTDYRVIACGAATSNIFTVVPLNIPRPTVQNNVTVVACNTQGTDVLIAQSTMPGVNFNWYDAAVGGTRLQSGDTMLFTGTPTGMSMPAIDTFWVAASTGNSGDTAIPAPHATVYSGNVRGYHFIAPIDFTITGLEVAQTAGTGNQSVAVLQTVGNVPWNVWNSPIVPFTTLHLTQNSPINGYIPVNINVRAGDVIAILGQRGNGNSYSNDNDIIIDGILVPIQRFIMQNQLATTAPASATQLGFEASSSISRVNFKYSVGCEGPRRRAIGEVNCVVGLEDFEAIESFELYPNPSNGLFNLKISSLQAEQLNLTVRDINGKALFNETINVNGSYQDILDFEGFAKGIYYLQIQNDEATRVEKIVIQ